MACFIDKYESIEQGCVATERMLYALQYYSLLNLNKNSNNSNNKDNLNHL